MVKSAKELIGQVVTVEPVQKEIPSTGRRTDWNFRPEQPFNYKAIQIMNLRKHYDGNRLFLDMFDGKDVSTVIIPESFKFRLLEAKEAKPFMEKYEAAMLKTLSARLVYNGDIGSDPEIFVEDPKGKVIPAFEFLGSKKKPTPGISADHANNTIYWDGFQAEFTTWHGHCMGWLGDSLHYGLRKLYEKAIEHNPKAKISAKTVMDIPKAMIKNGDPEHVQFGCMPSLNAYGMKGTGLDGDKVYFRPAGGHLHFGLYTDGTKKKKTKEQIELMVKALDAVVGVMGVSLFAKYDDKRRRELYGLAGEYRIPPHGLEYRTLSNAWLFHPLVANMIFDISRRVVVLGEKGFLKFWKGTEEETVKVINTCDVKGARRILKRNKDILMKIIEACGYGPKSTEQVYKAILGGMDSFIEDPTDIVKNWNLSKGVKGLPNNDDEDRDVTETRWVTHCNGPGKSVRSWARLKFKKV